MFGNEFYPSRDDIEVVETYDWDEKLNWELLPINVAVTYFGDDVIKSHYTNECMRFMKENSEYVKTITLQNQECYLRTVLLPMICNKLDENIKYLKVYGTQV